MVNDDGLCWGNGVGESRSGKGWWRKCDRGWERVGGVSVID